MADEIEVDPHIQLLLNAGALSEPFRKAMAAGEPYWDTSGLQTAYEVLEFAAPFVLVKRRSDGARGTLRFTHRPRFYFGWVPENPS